MTDWKELEDVGQPCSSENGWCGMCGNCCQHSEDVHERNSWGDGETPEKRKQRHLILYSTHDKMLAGFEGRNQSNGYATIRYWAGGTRTPSYTVDERLDCGTWKETLYKHEQEDWKMDVAGFEFYGLTIFSDTSAEGVRWAMSRVRGLWE